MRMTATHSTTPSHKTKKEKKNGLDDGNSKKEILTKKLKSVVGVGVNEVA